MPVGMRSTLFDPFFEFLARPEKGNVLASNIDLFPGARISPVSGRVIVEVETAKPSDLDSLARRQAVAHQVYQASDGQFDVFLAEVLLFGGQDLDQVGPGQ